MMEFYQAAAVMFGVTLFLGFPLAVALGRRETPTHASGWFLLAPALGMTLYFSAGTLLHAVGLHSFAVFWVLMGLCSLTSLYLLKTERLFETGKEKPLKWLAVVGICVSGALIALAFNSADLAGMWLEYFPLTNDDTFSYLGLIDQIRETGWITPRITYPAGYIPTLDHAIYARTPGIIFVADLADILGLQTHSAFFLVQRLGLPIVALGAAGVVMIATGSPLAALFCFSPLVFGNVLLHQILQQFNSSTMGCAIGTVTVALAMRAARTDQSSHERTAAFALAGWACGTMGITSPEAHPFYLLGLAPVAIFIMFRDRQARTMFICIAAFAAAYLVASCPFVIQMLPVVIGQFSAAEKHHSGDWIAAPGFLMQATGLTLTTAPDLASYPIVPLVTAIVVLSVLFWAALVLLSSGRKGTGGRRSDGLVLLMIAGLVLILQLALYLRGSGYGLLKLTDYFAFMGSVVIAVAAFQAGFVDRRIGAFLSAITVAAYCSVAFVQKEALLGKYYKIAAALPLSSAYKLDAGLPMTVVPDLGGITLNRFLYENRYGAAKIRFRAAEAFRYVPVQAAGSSGPLQIARMAQMGIAGVPLADITYPAHESSVVLTVGPAAGELHILEPDSNWLPAEGAGVGKMFRWLSVSGKFIIYGPILPQERDLLVYLANGPELKPENRVELYIADERVLSVASGDLPALFRIPLSAQPSIETAGEFRIVGPAAGIRQMSVSAIRTVRY